MNHRTYFLGRLVHLFVCIQGSLAVFPGSSSEKFTIIHETAARTPSEVENSTTIREQRRTRRNFIYWTIPVKDIEKAYISTENWTIKLRERIREKTQWLKQIPVFKSRARGENVTAEELLKAIASSEQLASRQPDSPIHVPPDGPTLVIYNYYETPLNKKNAEFFFRHHDPEWADVLFVVIGEKHSLELPLWVKVLPRENIGWEFCAMMEILPLLLYGKLPYEDKQLLALWEKRYPYFFILNASVRGPFYPLWPSEESNWVELFKRQLKKDVWLVGTSFNCMRNQPSLYHLQSFTLMTHRRGLEMIYEDLQQRLLIFKANNQGCEKGFRPPGKVSVIAAWEIGVSQTFLSRNIGIISLSLGWQGIDLRSSEAVNNMCMRQEDQYHPDSYFGQNINPFEVVFLKTNTANLERVDMKKVDFYTLWFDKRVGHYKVKAPEIEFRS